MISLLIASLLAAAQPAPVVAEPSPYFLDSSTVVQVICPAMIEGQPGAWLGTAFYIGDGKFITARHVVRDEDSDDKHLFGTCTIGGMPIKVLDIGKGFVDYALISAPVSLPYRVIYSCDGIQQSRVYYATGYAEGNPWLVTQRLIGSGSRSYMPGPGNNEDILRGTTFPGQSGGPVSDDTGVVVGIVSAGDENSDILSLSDTPLCRSTKPGHNDFSSAR